MFLVRKAHSGRSPPIDGYLQRVLDNGLRLVQATVSPTRQALYRLRMLTGLRCREASRIIWSDIDGSTLHLRAEVTKNGKADVVPLAGDVCDLLAGLQRDALKAGHPIQPDAPVFGPAPDPRTWKRDLKRAGIEYKVNDEQADPKCLRPTFNSHLEHAGIDLTLTGLLMRHKPAGGMALTLGTYGDETALLKCKRQAIGQLETWLVGQREPEVVQEWCSA